MSDTPETDKTASYEGNWDTKALRMTAHARRLERERNYYLRLLFGGEYRDESLATIRALAAEYHVRENAKGEVAATSPDPKTQGA